MNTDPSFNTFVISLPPDAIREFQIQTGTYTAELGAGTGQINVVTKSGTFDVRGSRLRVRAQQQVRLAGVHEPRRAAAVLAESVRRNAGRPAGRRLLLLRRVRGAADDAAHVEHHVRAGHGRRARRLQRLRADLRPADQSGQPAFNPALPISAANPQFIRDQFPDNKIPPNRINPVALAGAAEVRRAAEPATIRPTTISTPARRISENDAFNIRLDRVVEQRARRCSAATA